MKTTIIKLLFATVVIAGLSSCAIIRQGEVGVKRRLGRIHPAPLREGVRIFNPFLATVIKVPVRTMNMEVQLPLPSKEGLTVQSEVSILYRVEGQKAPQIIETIGRAYEEVVILPVFRSAVADVSARYYAKDMHTGQRAEIEKAIKEQMMGAGTLQSRGLIIESVLLKSIALPPGLTRAIEQKLEAEQDAQRMQFVLDKERQEAQRRIIEAEGIRDAQKLINEGLTPLLIKFKSIEAFNKLAASPNSKVIITNGDQPIMMTP